LPPARVSLQEVSVRTVPCGSLSRFVCSRPGRKNSLSGSVPGIQAEHPSRIDRPDTVVFYRLFLSN
jgi:hypothetical protein